MMRIFLDTNVLIDNLDASRPFHLASTRILRAAEDGLVEPIITGLTLVNTIYVMGRMGATPNKLRRYAAVILDHCAVASTDMPELQGAIHIKWPDFEDAVQYHAALHAGHVQAFITGDVEGFIHSRIPVLDPQAFVDQHL